MVPVFSSNCRSLRFSSKLIAWCKENNIDTNKLRFHVAAGNVTVYRVTRKIEFLVETYPYFIRYNVSLNDKFIDLLID